MKNVVPNLQKLKFNFGRLLTSIIYTRNCQIKHHVLSISQASVNYKLNIQNTVNNMIECIR